MSETTVPDIGRPLARPLEALMSYEHQRLIRRFMDDHHVTERTAQARFKGFKQFIAVCHMMDGDKITSDAIDTMWHTFLLFTRDYEEFCTQYLGEYIHHEPFETPNPGDISDTPIC